MQRSPTPSTPAGFVAVRLAVMFGVGLLGLSWSAVELKKGTERIERAIVEVRGRPEWSDGNNARSSRTIPIDPAMVRHTPSIADSK